MPKSIDAKMNELTRKFNEFLTANYPCGCGESEDHKQCPEEWGEARYLAEVAQQILLGDQPPQNKPRRIGEP